MAWSRRNFLQGAGASIALGAGILGIRCGQQAYARTTRRHSLIYAATPILTTKAADELRRLPPMAEQEIRDYFHGICLNTRRFVDEVCSIGFSEKLRACSTEEDQQTLFFVAFTEKVVGDVEVVNKVNAITGEVGKELDRNWTDCCSQISKAWREQVYPELPLSGDGLSGFMEDEILRSMQEARNVVQPLGQQPALGETISQVGRSALLLMPLLRIRPGLAVMVFLMTAFQPVFAYIAGLLEDREAGYQKAISTRLALLGNRVGAEFEREARLRIADLHHWQRKAVEAAADRNARESIPLLA